MPRPDLVSLLHAAGFLTGIALYAMLGAMLVRARGGGPSTAGRIPLATAALGLLWNAGALVLYGVRDAGLAPSPPVAAVGATAFAALGFLPAVLVHGAVQAAAPTTRHALSAAAWGVSAAAAALQAWSAMRDGAVPSRAALLLLTVGYAVVLALLALRLRRQPGARGPLAATALAAFAVMALHLSHHGRAGEPVAIDVLADHASLALALVILWQDYRFALADLFLERVLVIVALVGLALGAYLASLPVLAPLLARDPTDPRATALLLALWVATALAYPHLRRLSSAFVGRVVLRRTDYGALRASLAARVAALDAPADVLDATVAALAPALHGDVTWSEAAPHALPAAIAWADARRSAATVPVPTSDAPAYVLRVGALRGGRRLLSDDLSLLDGVATTAARRIDAVRVAQERVTRAAREHEIERLAAEAELRALRAQLNPHFLFNALTTVMHLVREAPDRALDVLSRLTGLLRAVLRPTATELVTLAEEMTIVEAYLAIEAARFEERLRVRIDVPAEARALLVPPLLVQPLVENAVKHGIAPLRAGGEVRVRARVLPAEVADTADHRRDEEARLELEVSDTGAGVAATELARRRAEGVGLASVERRLERLFGDVATFAFASAPGEGATVTLTLPADIASPAGAARARPCARRARAASRS